MSDTESFVTPSPDPFSQLLAGLQRLEADVTSMHVQPWEAATRREAAPHFLSPRSTRRRRSWRWLSMLEPPATEKVKAIPLGRCLDARGYRSRRFHV